MRFRRRCAEGRDGGLQRCPRDVPFDALALYHLRIGDLFFRRLGIGDHPGLDPQALDRHAQALRRHLEQHCPRFGSGRAQHRAELPDA
jgi:hypothetical protein